MSTHITYTPGRDGAQTVELTPEPCSGLVKTGLPLTRDEACSVAAHLLYTAGIKEAEYVNGQLWVHGELKATAP